MRKTLITVTIASIVGLGSVASGFPTYVVEASNIDSLKEKKNAIQSKQNEINNKMGEKNSEITKVQGEQQSVGNEIKRIDTAVEDTKNKIQDKEIEIKDAEANIAKLKEEITVLSDRIEKRNILLKDRARSFQENGRVSYIDVLLGSKSFTDFIDRISAMAVFVEADQGIIQEQMADKEELEKKQKEVEDTLSNLQKMHSDLKAMNAQLAVQKSEKEQLMSSLKKEEESMHAEVLELEEEEELLASQKKAMQKAIELEQKRQAEAAKASQASGSGGANVSSPAVSNGFFTRPAAGYISSGFGNRSLGNHKGVDIAASGHVPIVAAADGVVIKSYYSSSYGNAIFISHNYNGQVYTTVYAHMSSRMASGGQVVHKGQQIGVMGNTGQSFGQHLHFELHRGPWQPGQPNAINPVGIVPF